MKKRPIEKLIEEKVKMDFSFNDIENQINIEMYEKKKRNRRLVFPIIAPTFCSLLCFVILGVSIFSDNNSHNSEISDEINTSIFLDSSNNNVSNLENDRITEEDFNNSLLVPEAGTNNSDESFVEETYDKYDGVLIDAIKKENPDSYSHGPSLKLDLFEVIVNDYFIYEVSYLGNIDENYYCAYVDIDTANEIYDLYNKVLDAETASETNIIDGTIIKWFYSKKYDESLIAWYKISLNQKIPRIIDNKVVLGVYTLENVCINKEITAGYDINRTYNYYSCKRLIYEGGKYITTNYVNNIRKVWYSSFYDVENLEFDKDYFNYFELSFNDFNTLAFINDNEIKFSDDVNVILNPVDENQEKWNNFVNEISMFEIEKNVYYYEDIVNVFIK